MTRDLTTGKITPLLVRFTATMVLGNLFQMTYNAADSIIVGRYVGKEALAAVGICNPLMTLMILFINGLCIGAGVLVGMQYGSRDLETMKRQVSTTMIAGTVFSLMMALVCVLFARPILYLMQVDPAIMDLTAEYMRIVFTGLVFTYLYNFFSSMLRALGDARSPLIFLIVSAVINVLGDLFFVLVLHWGSRGCAIATLISEALSALFCAVYIHLRIPLLRLGSSWRIFDRRLLRKTVSYGWAGAVQQATVQFGKVLITGMVNGMGVAVAAAFAAVNRIDDFAFVPEQNIGHAMTAVVAQNQGAGKKARVWKSLCSGLVLEAIFAISVSLLCFFLAEPLMRLFAADEEVVTLGAKYLRLISLLYLFPGITNGMQGFFRGLGRLRVTLLSSMINMGARVLSAVVMIQWMGFGMEKIPLTYLVGWICMVAVETPMLLRAVKQYRLAADEE